MGRPGLAPTPPTLEKQRRDVERRPGTGDWQSLTHKLLDEARQQKISAQTVRDQSVVVKKVGDRDVQDLQGLVNGELKRKVAQTKHLRNKLEKQLAATTTELTLQIQERARTKEKLEARRRPLRVAEARVRQRLERPSVEQINDAADRTLRRETLELRNSVEQLTTLVRTSGELIARLEHSKRLLQSDLHDKTHSLELDMQCLEVRQSEGASSAGIALMLTESTGLAQQRATNVPEKWKRSTEALIAEAAELEKQSVQLRKEIRKAVQAMGDSNNQAKLSTDDALRLKVKQTQALCGQLQQNLRAVNEELEELARNRAQLQLTLDQKQGPLNVIRQRLAIRRKRPEREAVRDGVEEALEHELNKLRVTMDSLNEKLRACDTETERLQRLKRQLEQDCANKTSALAHDRRALQIDVNAVRSDWGGSARASDVVSRSARSHCSLPSISTTPRAAVVPG
eukprot:TRINITY_DN5209_c0_g1_i1.p1 TRINITY_DN5209_c0_g1~~TRINITY_DN5209_c0_g1_i1.p1  ORF type:complete len:484 (+),score=207.93 TRINITY_DN5209_c0_g1_i1:86-1453(+)